MVRKRARGPVRRLRALAGDERGSAMVEAALVLPVVLLLLAGVVMTGRVVQARVGVEAAVREAGRSAALAPSAADALALADEHGRQTAAGHGLAPARLDLAVELGAFERGGTVAVSASYPVALGDLPLLGAIEVTVTAEHEQVIERYRSRTVVTP